MIDFARVVSDNRASTMKSLMPNAYAVDQASDQVILMRQNICNIFKAVYDEDVVLRAMLFRSTLIVKFF